MTRSLHGPFRYLSLWDIAVFDSGGDSAGGGGEGSKGRSRNEMKTQTKINAELKKNPGGSAEVERLVKQRTKNRANTKANTGGYTSFTDMFDGGGPGKSGATYGSGGGAAADTNNDGYVSRAEAARTPLQQNFISRSSNESGNAPLPAGQMIGLPGLLQSLAGQQGPLTPAQKARAADFPKAPRKRYGTKGITSAQRSALEAKDYTVSPSGAVMSPSGGQVAGANFSGSSVVNSIMNNGELSGESLSFNDAFAKARKEGR